MEIKADPYFFICRVAEGHLTIGIEEANARLIAKAPDMYEFIKGLAEDHNLETPEEVAIAEALLRYIEEGED